MTLNAITKIFTRKTTRRSSGLGINPAREWFIGIMIALVLLSLGASYAMFSFWEHLNEGEQVLDSESDVVKYKEGLVREVLEHYQSRTERFEAIRGETGIDSAALHVETQKPTVFDGGTLGAE